MIPTQDIRFALRTLFKRNPTPTIVCIVTLALAIGANSAIFSVVNGALLQSLPYPEPDRLFQLRATHESAPGRSSTFVTGPNFLDYREGVSSFESLACLYTYSPEGFNLGDRNGARRINRLKVSSGYFETLGIAPILGRTFRREEELLEGATNEERGASYAPARRIAVLSYGLWNRHFQGSPEALGKAIRLSGEPYTVIGIMPAGLKDPIAGEVDVWVPHNLSPGGYNSPGNNYLTILGRLKPGVDPEAAQSELQALALALQDKHPANKGRGAAIVPLHQHLVDGLDRMLYILMGSVCLLLLVACVNVANLLLARGVERQREMAVRASLGSTRGRLVRQLLVESLILAAVGGLLGLLLAVLGVRALLALRPENLPIVSDVSFDLTIFLFATAVTLVTGLLFGIAPALQSSKLDIESCLRQGGRGVAARHRRTSGILVTAQLALALVLLVGAGLLIKSFLGVLKTDIGFDPAGVVSYRVDLPESDYGSGEKRDRFYEELHDRLRALPGVLAAGSISKLPADGPFHGWGFRIPGRGEDDELRGGGSQIRCADGDYFKALSIPLASGRLFDSRDHGDSRPVVLVSQALADRYWPGEDPVGRLIQAAGGERTIVGVIGDVRYHHLSPPPPMIYLPHSQFGGNRNWKLFQVVASASPGTDLLPLVRSEVGRMDPQLAVFRVRSLAEVVNRGISQQRFAASLMGAFAATALILAAVGVFGVLTHSVLTRQREIGIRMALGAPGRRVRRLVVRQAMRMTFIGIAIGTAAAYGASRWVASLIHDVSVTDPWVFASVVSFLSLVALVVGYVPALRASRLDPMAVLRQE